MVEYNFDTFQTAGGGLTHYSSGIVLLPSQYRQAQNLYNHSNLGALERRNGMSALGAQIHATNRIKSIYRGYSYGTANLKWLIETDGTNIRYRSASAWTNLSTTMTGSGLYWDFETYKGKVLMCDGTSAPQAVTITTDPPTLAAWTTMPSGVIPKMVRRFHNRICMAGDVDLKDRVYISDFGDETTFQSDNYLRFKNNQAGEEITAMEILNEDLLVLFGVDSIEVWEGFSPLTMSRHAIAGGIGCIARRTAVIIGGAIYYLGKVGDYFGIYRFDGSSSQLISYQIQRLLKANLNVTYISDMWAMRQGNKYVLFFTEKGQTNINNQWLMFDPVNNVWCGIHETNGTIGYDCGVQYQQGSGDIGEVYLGTSNGYCVKYDDDTVYTDNGTSYLVEFITGDLGYADRYTTKHWQELILQFWNKEYHTNISVYYALDNENSKGDETTATWRHFKDISLAPIGTIEGDRDNTTVKRDGFITVPLKFPDGVNSRYITIRLVSYSDYPIWFMGGQIIGEVI